MKNIMKYIMACLFSFAFFMTANAQTEMESPSPDDIICLQVSENVFECYLREEFDEETFEEENDKGQKLNEEYNLNEEDRKLLEEGNTDDRSVKEKTPENKKDISTDPMDGKIEKMLPGDENRMYNL